MRGRAECTCASTDRIETADCRLWSCESMALATVFAMASTEHLFTREARAGRRACMMHAAETTWTPARICMLVLLLTTGVLSFGRPLTEAFSIGIRDQEQSHILLAPLVAAWLVWLRRSRLKLVKWRPSALGTLVVLVGLATTWIGYASDVHSAWYLGAGLSLIGMLMSAVGVLPLRLFSPAFGAMLFLLPAPGFARHAISLPLQGMATSVTQSCLELLGVQVARWGNVLMVNGEAVTMTEACNGMRLVMSLTLVVYAFTFSLPLRWPSRLLLLLLSPLVAVAANVVRLVPTSFLYGQMSLDHAVIFHDVSGWLMLPLVLVILVLMLRMLRWMDVPVMSYRMVRE